MPPLSLAQPVPQTASAPVRVDAAQVLAALAVPLCVFDRDALPTGCNTEALRVLGVGRPTDAAVATWHRPSPEQVELLLPLVQTVLLTQASLMAKEIVVSAPGHSATDLLLEARLLRTPQGDTDGVVVSMRDVTGERHRHAETSERNDLLSGIVDATPECVKVISTDGRLLAINPAGLRMIAATNSQSLHRVVVADFIVPEHRDEWLARHHRVCAGERLAWEYDVIALNGKRIHMETHAAPMRLADGSTAQLAVTRDISARRREDARRMLLINELNHRVKNTLATVQAIATFSAGRASSVEEFRAAFEGRLLALSRAHELLTRVNWDQVSLHSLLRVAGAAYGESRIITDGDDVDLQPRMALSLAMVLHELATNAAKYGALSRPAGTVRLRTTVVGRPSPTTMSLQWQEADGPTVSPPQRRGFGTRLIERSVRGELGGAVNLAFNPPGLLCTIAVPLTISEPVQLHA